MSGKDMARNTRMSPPIVWRFFLMGVVMLVGLLVFMRPAAATTFYTDPSGYPAAWPSQLATQAYTRPGNVVSSDPASSDAGGDNSKNANPTQSSDFSRGGSSSNASFFYYGTGSILFFRIRVGGPPLALTGASEVFTSETWNILLDTDGDGYKEFAVMIHGIGTSENEPDDIVVVYKDSTSQKFDTGANGLWRQDSAVGGNNTSDGESGGSSTWDLNSNTYIWDWGRTRVTQIDTTLAPGHNNSEYYIDIQVPMEAFDTGNAATKLTATKPFTLSATTSNSNTDPTQKDFLYSGSFTLADVKLPTGNIVNGNGSIFEAPIIVDITSVLVCPSDTIKVTVLDAVDQTGGTAVTTVSSVTVQYYTDSDGDSLLDDGSTWLNVGSASLVSGTVNLWRVVWDASQHSNKKYIFRAIATDSNGNTTYSSSQSPSNVYGYVNNSCNAVPSFDTSTKGLFDVVSPVSTTSVPRYVISTINSGTVTATNVVVTDTLSVYLKFNSFVLGTGCTVDSTSIPGRYIITCALGTMTAGASRTRSFRVSIKTPVSDSTNVTNKAYITADSPAPLYCSEITFMLDSKPSITLTKNVNGVVDTSGVPGDTLLFSIYYQNTGTDTATTVTVIDANPDYTGYVVNSVKYKGVAKTDASDADEVTVTPSGNVYNISVSVGSVPPDSSGTVTFKTIMQ